MKTPEVFAKLGDMLSATGEWDTGRLRAIASQVNHYAERATVETIRSAANRLSTIRETDTTGLALDDDIANLRHAIGDDVPAYFPGVEYTEGQEWKTMDIAPRDGTVFLAFVPHDQSGFAFVAMKTAAGQVKCMMSGRDYTAEAIRWMPLPAHPKREDATQTAKRNPDYRDAGW